MCVCEQRDRRNRQISNLNYQFIIIKSSCLRGDTTRLASWYFNLSPTKDAPKTIALAARRKVEPSPQHLPARKRDSLDGFRCVVEKVKLHNAKACGVIRANSRR